MADINLKGDALIEYPEAQLICWLVPVESLEDIENPDCNHAYQLPDDTIWVKNRRAAGFIELTGDGEPPEIMEILNNDGFLVVTPKGGGVTVINLRLDNIFINLEQNLDPNDMAKINDLKFRFTQAVVKENIKNTDTMPVILGKIQRFFYEQANPKASNIAFDPANTGLKANNVQEMLELLDREIGKVNSFAIRDVTSKFTVAPRWEVIEFKVLYSDEIKVFFIEGNFRLISFPIPFDLFILPQGVLCPPYFTDYARVYSKTDGTIKRPGRIYCEEDRNIIKMTQGTDPFLPEIIVQGDNVTFSLAMPNYGNDDFFREWMQ